MRRFVSFAVLLLFTVPFGVSISGCKATAAPDFCNGSDSGPTTGQLAVLTLQPRLTGISINEGQISTVGSPAGTDCKGGNVSASKYTFGSTNLLIADINPTSGQLCAGSWNRNSGAGVADYTTCAFNPLVNSQGTAYVTATADGVSSNPVPVYVHPVVTSIVLGGNLPGPCSGNNADPTTLCGLDATQTNGCSATAPAIDAITSFSISGNVVTFAAPNSFLAGTTVSISGLSVGTYLNGQTLTVLATGLSSNQFEAAFTHANVATTTDSGLVTVSGYPSLYTGNACVSENSSSQLFARVYAGTQNITCLAGPLSYSPQNSSVVAVAAASEITNPVNSSQSILQTGLATALQSGTTIVGASTSQSSSSAGLFSTCPPASIGLTVANTGATSATIDQNASQNLTASVVDTTGKTLNNLTLEYVSTTPTTIQPSGLTVTPTFPGSASITAICQPPGCNPSPFNQINLFGTGLPVVSNAVSVNAPGTNSTVLYIASTGSQYVLPVDFTNSATGTPVRLPFAPNSMVMSDNLSAIYMGTATELMVFSATSNTLGREDNTVAGTVLSVSPDSNTVVITDPVRQLVYLYNASGSVSTEIGGVGTHAQWSPDSSTVYITTSTNEILVHSTLLGWYTIAPTATDTSPSTSLDVAVTVPSQGAYFAGPKTTARTNCPVSTVTGTPGAYTVANAFYPLADTEAVATDRIAATTSGTHILGASAASAKFVDFTLAIPASACPGANTTQRFVSSPSPLLSLGVAPTAITGVLATSDSDFGFVTYTGTGGTIPQYNVSTGTLSNVALQTVSGSPAPTAPVAGVLSANDTTLYVGTSGDNLVHILARSASGFADSTTITPSLPGLAGGIATPNLLVQRPRKNTN